MTRKRKINDTELLQLHEGGQSQAELASHFNCSIAAVSKRLKRLMVPESMKTLSPQQAAFVKAKASGMSGSAAAKLCFNCCTDVSARNIASQLLRKPEVMAAMSDWLEWSGIGRERRVQRLKEFVEHPDPSVAFPALKEVMKAGDDFPSQRLRLETQHEIFVVGYSSEGRESAQLEEPFRDVEFECKDSQ